MFLLFGCLDMHVQEMRCCWEHGRIMRNGVTKCGTCGKEVDSWEVAQLDGTKVYDPVFYPGEWIAMLTHTVMLHHDESPSRLMDWIRERGCKPKFIYRQTETTYEEISPV